MDIDWDQYLRGYHQRHPGITEDLLTRACDPGGSSPYDILLSRLPASPTRILDVACGSGPLSVLARTGSLYVGADRSEAELRGARERHPHLPLVLADALALPVSDGSIDAVTCSMALMLLRPLGAALAEVARVLRPGGQFEAMYPGRGLPRAGQIPAVIAILAAVRIAPQYPQDIGRAAISQALADSGMRLGSLKATRYALPVETPEHADQVIDGLYLPGTEPERIRRAHRALRHRAKPGLTVPLHITHLTAIKV